MLTAKMKDLQKQIDQLQKQLSVLQEAHRICAPVKETCHQVRFNAGLALEILNAMPDNGEFMRPIAIAKAINKADSKEHIQVCQKLRRMSKCGVIERAKTGKWPMYRKNNGSH